MDNKISRFYDNCRAGNVVEVEKALVSEYARFLNKYWAINFAIKHIETVYVIMQDHPGVESVSLEDALEIVNERGYPAVAELLIQHQYQLDKSKYLEMAKL